MNRSASVSKTRRADAPPAASAPTPSSATSARVVGKHVKNQCAFFQPKIVKDLSADKGKQPMTENDARKAFDALFKK